MLPYTPVELVDETRREHLNPDTFDPFTLVRSEDDADSAEMGI